MTMSKFNKRHYEAIALVLQDTFPAKENDELSTFQDKFLQWNAIRQELADTFKRDNSLFDDYRFKFACQPGSNVRAKTAHLKAV
jgi:hypothetical protein